MGDSGLRRYHPLPSAIASVMLEMTARLPGTLIWVVLSMMSPRKTLCSQWFPGGSSVSAGNRKEGKKKGGYENPACTTLLGHVHCT